MKKTILALLFVLASASMSYGQEILAFKIHNVETVNGYHMARVVIQYEDGDRTQTFFFQSPPTEKEITDAVNSFIETIRLSEIKEEETVNE